jgi:3-(3-hydroxy-phenyl)propionate hydroxylase
MTGFDCDVLVVGLGPVGAALAALLARRGISVIAIEKDAAVYPMPRAAHFDHEVMRLLQQLGVADEAARHAREMPACEFRAADGQLLMRGSSSCDSPSGWALGYMFHQPSLELALRNLLDGVPTADIRLGWRFESLVQDAQGVVASLTSPVESESLRARYVVGCDGAWSPVREAIGGGLFDYEFDEPWLVVDAKVGPDSRVPDINLQICDPARPVTCMLMAPGRHRWEFMLLPGETAKEVLEDGFVEALIEGLNFGPVEIERKAVYRFHGLVANRWRDGRVLIAGDAAHQTPPFAGQGMCAGLRDVANLAWKLEAVLTARADVHLLNTYQAEREPHTRRLIEFAIDIGRLVCTLDPEAAAARDQRMLAQMASGAPSISPTRPAPLESDCVLVQTPAAGQLFPQPTCGHGEARRRMDDVLGDGPWLIARTPTGLKATDEQLSIYTLDDNTLTPFSAALTAWLNAHNAEAVLVRPDRYVFGTGTPAQLAQAWTNALRPMRHAA